MGRYAGAKWRPVSGHTDGPMRSHLGAVLHVNESNGNLYNWVAGDHNMSCHFEVYKSGAVEQYLDTAVSSWCQMAGNADYVSIETEGYATEAFTEAQVQAIAKLVRWLHTEHGIPLQLADKPGARGLGWHGMGGSAWGGHTGCPGEQRKAQRARILSLAGHPSTSGSTPATHPAPAASSAPHPVTGDGYRFRLYTLLGGHSTVFAFAPGRWFPVDHYTAAALVNHGECDGTIHQVHGVTLQRLRLAAIGRNR